MKYHSLFHSKIRKNVTKFVFFLSAAVVIGALRVNLIHYNNNFDFYFSALNIYFTLYIDSYF